jgi:hypothetical protein
MMMMVMMVVMMMVVMIVMSGRRSFFLRSRMSYRLTVPLFFILLFVLVLLFLLLFVLFLFLLITIVAIVADLILLVEAVLRRLPQLLKDVLGGLAAHVPMLDFESCTRPDPVKGYLCIIRQTSKLAGRTGRVRESEGFDCVPTVDG